MKGANGATCDGTCKARGKTCDVSELNKLTSNAKVGAAFKQAGYTCKGYHAPRNYPGTPFSTARSDDCAPVIPGKTVTCSGNSHGHHAALCYCTGGGALPTLLLPKQPYSPLSPRQTDPLACTPMHIRVVSQILQHVCPQVLHSANHPFLPPLPPLHNAFCSVPMLTHPSDEAGPSP